MLLIVVSLTLPSHTGVMDTSRCWGRGEWLQRLFILLVLILGFGLFLPANSFAQIGPDSSYVRPAYERGDAQLRLISTTGTLGATQGVLIATGIVDPFDSTWVVDEYIGSLFGGMLIGGAVGTIVPLIATQNVTVRRDAATLTAYGGVQGYAHASELILMIGGEDGVPLESGTLLIAGGGAVEATAGYIIGQRWNAYAAASELLAVTGAAGHLIGYGATRGLGAPRVDPATNGDERLYAGGALTGSLLGMWAGYRLGQTGEYTTGDARLYALSGLIGAGLGLSTSQLSRDATARRNVAVAASGAAIGLSTGAIIGQAYDFTPSEGNIIVSAGFLTGSLLGAMGQAAFEGDDGDENSAANLLVTSLGTAIGAGVTIAFLGSDARERKQDRQNAAGQPVGGQNAGQHTGAASSAVRLDVNVSPYVPSGPMPSNASQSGLRPALNLKLQF